MSPNMFPIKNAVSTPASFKSLRRWDCYVPGSDSDGPKRDESRSIQELGMAHSVCNLNSSRGDFSLHPLAHEGIADFSAHKNGRDDFGQTSEGSVYQMA